MSSSKPPPKYVPGGRYADYHPGNVELSSEQENWDGLLLTRYSHPIHSDGMPRPATSDHILAFSDNGAVKGEYSFNHSKWQPYVWRQSEWMIGQAYENDRDSRWDSLCPEDVELSVCYLHLSPQLLNKVASEVTGKSPGFIEIPHKMGFRDPFMYQIGVALRDQANSGCKYGNIFVESAANLLAVHLLKNYSTDRFVVADFRGKNNRGVRQVVDYIHDSLAQPLSLDTMARLANMSTYHFARTFKRSMGVPPHHYVMLARIEKAKGLLHRSNLPINLIAHEVGYNPSHFVQLFKKSTGVTPGVFRKLRR